MGAGTLAKGERELSFDDDEAVGVLVMDVRLRSALPWAVVELRDDDLVGVEEDGGAPSGPRGDRLAFLASRTADDDEARVSRRVLGRRLLVESGRRAADIVAVSRVRGVEDEVPRRLVARHLESVDDPGGTTAQRLGADQVCSILEPKCELSLEDEQRLGVSRMDVERRSSPARSRTHFDRSELLDVHEERDAELLAVKDDLAFDDLDHEPAA